MAVATLGQIALKMKALFDRAPGHDCTAWWNFVDVCRYTYNCEPLHPKAATITPTPFHTEYWLAVADGKSPEYDPHTGQKIDVDPV
jgi:hypothetical protein